jgi:hypothetical protein
MGITTDPNDPRFGHGYDHEKIPQHEVYLVLSQDEIAKGYVRPYRDAYVHETCGRVTTMGKAIAETYARQPEFYGATYCVHCQKHLPVGKNGEFHWYEMDGTHGPKVGT